MQNASKQIGEWRTAMRNYFPLMTKEQAYKFVITDRMVRIDKKQFVILLDNGLINNCISIFNFFQLHKPIFNELCKLLEELNQIENNGHIKKIIVIMESMKILHNVKFNSFDDCDVFILRASLPDGFVHDFLEPHLEYFLCKYSLGKIERLVDDRIISFSCFHTFIGYMTNICCKYPTYHIYSEIIAYYCKIPVDVETHIVHKNKTMQSLLQIFNKIMLTTILESESNSNNYPSVFSDDYIIKTVCDFL